MPELPEVEAARDMVQNYLVGSRVECVLTTETGGGPRQGQYDDIVNENSPSDLTNALLNRTLLGAYRKGKQMWLELSEPSSRGGGSITSSGPVDISVLFHFGMTGMLVLHGPTHRAAKYKSFTIHDEHWPPKFCKLELVFSNGEHLAYCDPRRIGRIRVRSSNCTEELPISKLARDPIYDGLDMAHFLTTLATCTQCIKTALLSQELLFCGIGNWLADEVLYQAHIHPNTRCNALALHTKAAELLGQTIIRVCRTAADCAKKGNKFPAEFLFHYRWEKTKKQNNGGSVSDQNVEEEEKEEGEEEAEDEREGAGDYEKKKKMTTKKHSVHKTSSKNAAHVARDFFGNVITFETVGGRTSAVVPALQHLITITTITTSAGNTMGGASACASASADVSGSKTKTMTRAAASKTGSGKKGKAAVTATSTKRGEKPKPKPKPHFSKYFSNASP